MTFNNPFPSDLNKELRKCARILTAFTRHTDPLSADRVIPPSILHRAHGLAILSVVKAGFVGSGRFGSGVVIARLPDGSWSAPSAITTAGIGVGAQVGFELTDVVFILNDTRTVRAFADGESLTLGTNVSIAAGPIGRNAEAGGAASKNGFAGIFAYSRTKGMFAGISLEGSVVTERKEANAKLYLIPSVSSRMLLSGQVRPPETARDLIAVLNSPVFTYAQDGTSPTMAGAGHLRNPSSDSFQHYPPNGNQQPGYDGWPPGDLAYGKRPGDPNLAKMTRDHNLAYPPNQGSPSPSLFPVKTRADLGLPELNRPTDAVHHTGAYHDAAGQKLQEAGTGRDPDQKTSSYGAPSVATSPSVVNGHAAAAPLPPSSYAPSVMSTQKPGKQATGGGGGGGSSSGTVSAPKAKALFTFSGDQDGDLTFDKGDIITVWKRTDSQDDWWTGSIGTRTGLFPANYVELL